MQATISRRFILCLVALLGTTVLPWFVYGKILPAQRQEELDQVNRDIKAAGDAVESDRVQELRTRATDLEKGLREDKYELKFGLDLRGGASITYRVHAEDPLDQALREVAACRGQFGIAEVTIQDTGAARLTASFTVAAAEGKKPEDLLKTAHEGSVAQLGLIGLIEERYEPSGTGSFTATYRLKEAAGSGQSQVLEEAHRVIQSRLDKFGVSEVNIVESGTDQLTVELPGRGKEEIDRIKGIMHQVGSLEFRIVAEPSVASSEQARNDREKETYVATPGFEWYVQDKGPRLLLEVPDKKAEADLQAARQALANAQGKGAPETETAPLRAAVEAADKAFKEATDRFTWTGRDLDEVSAEKTPITEGGRGFQVNFSIIPSRKTAFGDFTGDNIERQMAIVLNSSVHTAPVIHSKLPGSGMIYSKQNPYTQESAKVLVTVLQSGSLKVKPEEVSSFVVGPGLGEDAVRRGRLAVGISFLLVVLFMAFFYRGAGWVANLAVLLNLVMTLGVLMFMGAALSLPGIAGLLLTLGMAVDANILVNERIREEKAAGKGLLQAVTAGYDRAFITILDSNLTTILTAVILYWIGTGPIRGFALTLIIGLVISMFTALYITRTLFLWGMEKGILTEFRMAEVFGRTNFSWMAMRAPFFRVSIALIVAGTAAFLLRSVDSKYDLEFTGGQRVVVAFRQKMSIDALKKRIADAKLGDIAVRTIRGRGADAANLDLATESYAFELTSRIKDEAEGRVFTGKVAEAFKAELVPPGIEGATVSPKDASGLQAFGLVAHFAHGDGAVAEKDVLEVLQNSPLLKGATDLKVEPAAGTDGSTAQVTTFRISGKSSHLDVKDPPHAVAAEVEMAVKRKEGLDLSEPVPQADFIGPGVARRLRDQAMMAVLLSLIAQIVYLRVRFRDFTYGFAAAIALAHDVLITLGAVAVFDAAGLVHVKINLPVIAAFLTLIGYSMNDTIVVFDRIRENLGRSVHPTSTLINAAINQTLARSIRTSMTVLLVALCLFAVNYGATSSLEGFGFVMAIGVITGTYSSVAIASPLLLFLPVYSERLRALGQKATWGLMAALFIGLAVAFEGDGVMAVAGMVLACLLPAHMLYYLAGWLTKPDPDALIPQG